MVSCQLISDPSGDFFLGDLPEGTMVASMLGGFLHPLKTRPGKGEVSHTVDGHNPFRTTQGTMGNQCLLWYLQGIISF